MAEEQLTVPQHIGFILDGNRRWARQHGIPEFDGHLAGYNALRDVTRASFEAGVKYVSIYAFSTENWKRDSKEVSHLMKLALHAFSRDLKNLVTDKIRVRFLGRKEGLSGKLLASIEEAERLTARFKNKTLAICFNYGGQQEIIDAVHAAVREGISANKITQRVIDEHLYAPDIPTIDLVVRTSGEQRLSNFMIWRTVYSEFLFLDKYWPDMTKEDVLAAIQEYERRQRRFGQ